MDTKCDEQELISRLMNKVSEQALELSELSSQLENSRQILSEESIAIQMRTTEDSNNHYHSPDNLKSSLNASTSNVAIQRRMEKDHNMQMLALQRQLEITESKLAENIKAKKKQLQDLDTKTREASFYMKKCQDVQVENQQLRQQIEQTLKMSSITAKTKGIKQPMKSIDNITYIKVCDDLKHTQIHNNNLNKELNSYKNNEKQLQMKIKILEDALELRSEEIGLSGHSDLLSKVAKLRGEVSALKSELTNKHTKIIEYEDNNNEINNTHTILNNNIKQLQLSLSEKQKEIYLLKNGNIYDILKTIEKERDQLLNFIENDMKNSTELNKRIELLESDLRLLNKKNNSLLDIINKNNIELKNNNIKYNELLNQYNNSNIELNEIKQLNNILESDKIAINNQYQRKNVESEELNRMQMNLFSQVKSVVIMKVLFLFLYGSFMINFFIIYNYIYIFYYVIYIILYRIKQKMKNYVKQPKKTNNYEIN